MIQRILVVEDDVQIRKFICYCLENNDYEYLTAANGQDALRKIANENIDLILLDLGLPDIDGVDIIRKLREFLEIPIIVVSARDKDKEKAQVLDLGADDYLTKPFSATELIARIKVAFRHYYRFNQSQLQTFYKVKDLSIDLNKHLVYLNNQELHVTPMEYQLLTLFFQNIGKVLTTHTIIEEIYGKGYGNDTQALRALMAGLRRKIEKNPATPEYIMTEIGVGYRLKEDGE
ncbi:response regulator [Candidatus Stoquefichus sp. SB1]|uniref:response regulator n=1 Tax=Candidatus Stoquefichus sp. SB1 TaxID=1658109 RepID=UPI00067E7DD2|nr:response regulator transcription factor [Candidatus Stoquefichus sp. SB1]